MRPARGGDDHPARPGVPVAGRGALLDAAGRPPAGLRRLLRRVRRRRLRRDRARRRRPTGCPASPTACAPRRSPTPCSHRPRARRWVDVAARPTSRMRRWRDEARLPHRRACPSAASRRSPPGPARTATRRSSSRPGRSSATARSPPATSRPTRSTTPRPSASARALDDNGLVLSALAYYDNNLDPDPAERDANHAHVRACIDAAAALGGVPGRHVHRPRPRPQRRREPARGRARLPAARRLRGRARREADDRELRHGGLAPRRLPRQPRLLARAVGVDVRARPVPELRSRRTCCGSASTRSRR